MKVYEYTKVVTNEDIDTLNHVNNVRYVDWVNEAAKLHWNLVAPKRLKDHYYWVVLRHQIDYKGPAFLNDALLIKTFVRKTEGVKSFRVIEMYNQETNKLLLQAETIWCMVDSKTHRPSRISEDIISLFH